MLAQSSRDDRVGHDDAARSRAQEASARRSSTRAFTQSRCTVRTVMPSASAVSSSVRPPKKRHSTTRASRGSKAASRSSASSSWSSASGWSSTARSRVVERDALPHAAALERDALPRAIDEHVPHRQRRDGEEVRAIAPVGPRLVDELEVGLVDERRRRERAGRAARGEPAVRDGAQLLVGERDEPIDRLGRVAAELGEQVDPCRRGGHVVIRRDFPLIRTRGHALHRRTQHTAPPGDGTAAAPVSPTASGGSNVVPHPAVAVLFCSSTVAGACSDAKESGGAPSQALAPTSPALATVPVASTSTLLGRATFNDPKDPKLTVKRVTGDFHVEVKAKPALDVAMQSISFPAGAQSTWHKHPGPVFIIVARGRCVLRVRRSDVHAGREDGGAGVPRQGRARAHRAQRERRAGADRGDVSRAAGGGAADRSAESGELSVLRRSGRLQSTQQA